MAEDLQLSHRSLMNALFASALKPAACCLASSLMSCRVKDLKSGEGGTLVGGVEMGVDGPGEDEVLMF